MSRNFFRAALAAAALACLPVLAAPTPITACQAITQPGSYIVMNNLASSTGDCLRVGADFVTIDLNGFVLTGNRFYMGITTLREEVLRGITVRNGVLQNFFVGVALYRSTSVTVERVVTIGNAGNGIELGDHGVVRDSVSTGNVNSGISVAMGGMLVNNTASENGLWGLTGGTGTAFIGNVARSNKDHGINTVEGASLEHNSASGNGRDGLHVVCPSAVIANAAYKNAGVNLYLSTGACTVDHNSAP
jgi:hypothetical protein